jgi:hypothetical protein
MNGCGACRFDELLEDTTRGEEDVKNVTWAAREAELQSIRADCATAVPVLVRKPEGTRRRSIDQPEAMKLLRAEQAKVNTSHALFEALHDENCKLRTHMKDPRWVAARTDIEQVEDARRIESLKFELDKTRIKILAQEHAVKGYKADKLEERKTHIASFRSPRGFFNTDADTSTTLESLFPGITRRDAAPGSPVAQPVRSPPETAPLPPGKSAAPSTCLTRDKRRPPPAQTLTLQFMNFGFPAQERASSPKNSRASSPTQTVRTPPLANPNSRFCTSAP